MALSLDHVSMVPSVVAGQRSIVIVNKPPSKKKTSPRRSTSATRKKAAVKANSAASDRKKKTLVDAKANTQASALPEEGIVDSPLASKPADQAEKPGVARNPEPITDSAEASETGSQTDATPSELHLEMEPARPESVHIEEPLPEMEAKAADAQGLDTGASVLGDESGEDTHAFHPESPQQSLQPEPEPLYVVHISPEMAPVAKVGGLADVVFGLSGELALRGNHVEVILPKYDNMRYDQIHELHEVYTDLWVPWYEGGIHCTVWFGFVHERKCYFIEPHSTDNFFARGSVYGFDDDVQRYGFFSRAAIEFLYKSGKHPDVIHCHDWQTALVPVFLYEIYQQLGMSHSRACLTIHNFAHQGLTGMEMLRAGGLNKPEHFFDYNRLRDNSNPYALNLLKGGIVYANFVTTVSPRYAEETRHLGEGMGLEPTLETHQVKYGGVVNGIDYAAWNPESDTLIPARYSADDLDPKYAVKRALRQRLMLADNEKPIVAFIGRLDPQKGLELVRHGIFYALEKGAQFVLLGSSPNPVINEDFWGLKHMLNDSEDCHLEIGFDEELAHLIYAGSDMMLVPSRFEPCGLTQLISMRYGCVPVVRAVGGLADTVFDKDHSDKPLHERNGYVFQDYDNPGLESALGRAIACYYQHPDHFRELIKNAMRSDYSWNHPGRDYLNIYHHIRHK